MLVRTSKDGTLWIPRNDPAAEGNLDTERHRVRDTELRWLPWKRDGHHIEKLYGEHAGKRGVLFGKGPSLDSYKILPRETDVTVAINETVLCLPFDPTFVVLIDVGVIRNLFDNHGWRPGPGTTVITRWDRFSYFPWRDDGGVVYFTYDRRGCRWNYASAGTAIMLMRALGMMSLVMVGFDGLTNRYSTYAEVVAGKIRPPNAALDWYAINQQIDHALAETGMDRTCWHDPQHQEALLTEAKTEGRVATGDFTRHTATDEGSGSNEPRRGLNAVESPTAPPVARRPAQPSKMKTFWTRVGEEPQEIGDL